MATRKQKHHDALERRARFMAEYRHEGQEALRKDRERRARQKKDEWRDRHEKHYKFETECPLCADIRKNLKVQV